MVLLKAGWGREDLDSLLWDMKSLSGLNCMFYMNCMSMVYGLYSNKTI